jgi:hypothetical protein
MTRNLDGLYKITAALSGTAWIVLFALLVTIPLMAMHLYTRAYIGPTIESSDDLQGPERTARIESGESASVRAG